MALDRRLNPRMRKFLKHYARTGSIPKAAEIAGIHRATVYKWRDDPDFAAAFNAADDSLGDIAEAELFRRGIHGWSEPVVSAGRVVTKPDGSPHEITKWDSRALEILVKGRRPRYRDHGPTIQIAQQVNVAQLAERQVEIEEQRAFTLRVIRDVKLQQVSDASLVYADGCFEADDEQARLALTAAVAVCADDPQRYADALRILAGSPAFKEHIEGTRAVMTPVLPAHTET